MTSLGAFRDPHDEMERIRKLRPAGYGPASTRTRDGHCIVVCGTCDHESIGDFFGAVWSLNPADAWYRHRIHVDSQHPVQSDRASALEKVAALLEDIASHEGHRDIQVCVEDMVSTAKAALVIANRELDRDDD